MSHSVPHPPGQWLDPTSGMPVEHGALLKRLARERVVLLGETHNRFDIHRWQLHVAAGLLALRGNIALGFEMFPVRVQGALDAWVAGELDPEAFLAASEWNTVWRFDPALYMPLFEFCRQFGVPMLALNCRRELVSQVGRKGWEAIDVADRDGLTPARPATLDYRQYLYDISGGGRSMQVTGGPDDPAFDRFVRAQQTWDRAFACNIARALHGDDPPLVVGIIGRGHLEYGHGTPAQLADLGIDRVSVLLPSDAAQFDLAGKAGIALAMFRTQPHAGDVAPAPPRAPRERSEGTDI